MERFAWEEHPVDADSDVMLSSVRKVAFALDEFEPFPQSLIAESVLDRLIEGGLIEAGRSCRPAVGAVGYRLTDQGWKLASARWTDRPALF